MARLSGYQVKAAHKFCVDRNGSSDCEKKDITCRGKTILHHRDGNAETNPSNGSNWGILCVSHNRREVKVVRSFSNNYASRMKLEPLIEFERVGKRERRGVRGVSRELEKSEIIRPQIENYILQAVYSDGAISMRESRNSCSFLFKCDQATVQKYIDGLTSMEGPLREKEINGMNCLVLKD